MYISLLCTSFTALLSSASEHILRYLNADDGKVVGTTYSAMWGLIGDLDCCEYFDNSQSGDVEESVTTVKSKTGNSSKSSTVVSSASSNVKDSVTTVKSKTGNGSKSSTSISSPSGDVTDSSYRPTVNSKIASSTYCSTAINSVSANIAGSPTEVITKSVRGCVTTVITKNDDNQDSGIVIKEKDGVPLASSSCDHSKSTNTPNRTTILEQV